MPQAKPTRPRRQRKHDRITYGGKVTNEEIAVDHALAPLDAAAREADRTWGVDRLIELVSPETAMKFGRVLGRINDAIEANDAQAAAKDVAIAIRGYAAMDKEAREAGHTPPDPRVVVVGVPDGSGASYGILLDDRLWKRASEEYPGVRLFTLQEIAILIHETGGSPLVDAVKAAFPGATITGIKAKQPMDRQPEDALPF